MDDDRAFLAAIRHDPADDTARLVYADWLDDRGDPRGPFEDRRLYRVWVSLRVATDVLPLLVNACSDECVGQLPAPPAGYVATPHRGGPRVRQPPAEW